MCQSQNSQSQFAIRTPKIFKSYSCHRVNNYTLRSKMCSNENRVYFIELKFFPWIQAVEDHSLSRPVRPFSAMRRPTAKTSRKVYRPNLLVALFGLAGREGKVSEFALDSLSLYDNLYINIMFVLSRRNNAHRVWWITYSENFIHPALIMCKSKLQAKTQLTILGCR
jgi:hypothetical protein